MIKPSLESITHSGKQSFLVRSFELPEFSAPYHLHPEYELTLITRGEGKRYVGNHMEYYGPGDLILLGKNLPHCWKTDPVIPGELSGSIVIQFTDDFLGKEFFESAELSGIKQLLQRSSKGIAFPQAGMEKPREQMHAIVRESAELKKLLMLLEMLDGLSGCKQSVSLDTTQSDTSQPSADLERVNPVLVYIIDQFRYNVELTVAARLTNMTTNSFCKYFKRTTGKTFIETVVEYRLNYAIQQLIHTNKSVTEIGYDSGFNDIGHFSRMFKRKMQQSPLQYRFAFRKYIG